MQGRFGSAGDYRELEMSVGRGREKHESLEVCYRKSPEYPEGREVDLGALEDHGELEMSVGRARVTYESLYVRHRKPPEETGICGRTRVGFVSA